MSAKAVLVMRRLYFMLPNAQSCKKLVAELRKAGIPERRLHVVASLAVPLEDLPEANLLQRTDLARGIERGLALGGTAGLLGGLLVVTFPPAGLVVGGGALMTALAAGGAGFGALALGLISTDVHNKDLAAFERDIAHGRILLIVDVPKEHVDQWKQLIVEHHPEAEIGVAMPPVT
jgi:hypothetical protein